MVCVAAVEVIPGLRLSASCGGADGDMVAVVLGWLKGCQAEDMWGLNKRMATCISRPSAVHRLPGTGA